MKRVISTAILAGLTLFSVGCCYHAGGCDPNTGMTYAGQWQPSCCGPLDPFGIWCGNQWNCCPQGAQGYAAQPFQSGCCPQPAYGMGYSGQMIAPQTFAPDCYSNGMSNGTMMPGGMMPVPAPGSEEGKPEGSKKSTMIVPQPMSQGAILQGADSGQWVKAF